MNATRDGIPFAATPKAIALGAVYVALIFLFEASYGYGLLRGASMCGMLALLLAVAAESGAASWPGLSNATWFRIAMAASMVPLVAALLYIPTVHHVRSLDGLVATAFIIGSCALAARHPVGAGLKGRKLAFSLVALVLLIPALNLFSGMVVPKLLDIATTTADAARVIWSGGNPYVQTIDTSAVKLMHDLRFGGYKYLPVMALAYLPFVLAFGNAGVLVGNAIMYAGAVAVVARAGRDLNGPGMAGQGGRLAALLFICTPLVTVEALSVGATDIAPTLLLLCAMMQVRRSALLTGLLIGLSLSMKLAPALFAATIFFPWQRRAWWQYTAGLLLGVLPALVYMLWAPGAFIDNIIVFNGLRPADVTSWRYAAPAWAGQVASVISVLCWLAGSLWCAIRQASLARRVWTYTAVVMVVLLCASADHDNYVTWWAPFFTLLIGCIGPPRQVNARADPTVATYLVQADPT